MYYSYFSTTHTPDECTSPTDANNTYFYEEPLLAIQNPNPIQIFPLEPITQPITPHNNEFNNEIKITPPELSNDESYNNNGQPVLTNF